MARLKGLPPSLKKIIAFTGFMGALSVVFVVVVIVPQIGKRSTLSAEFEQVSNEFNLMLKNISEIGVLRDSVSVAERTFAETLTPGILEPLLGSYEMRALRLVAPHAQHAGITLAADSVRCLPQLPIKPAESAKGRVYVRQPIEFTGSGSYEAIMAFMNEIETQMPLVCVSSLRILGQRTPEEHTMLIALEWPVLAEVKAVKGTGVK